MKKLIVDNIYIFVILAIALAAYAVFRIRKSDSEKVADPDPIIRQQVVSTENETI